MSLRIKGMSTQLIVADLQRSTAFYTEQLGFKIAFLYEEFYAAIARDGFSIHLKSGSPCAGERADRRKNEDLDISFAVENIEQLYEYIRSKQVEIVQHVREMPYGREFYIADPDGYILAFVEEK